MELDRPDAESLEALEARSNASIYERAFGQPEDQQLPSDFLAMLVELDRSKR